MPADERTPRRARLRHVQLVQRRGHALASAVEAASIHLSTERSSLIELALPSGTVQAPTDRATFDEAIADEMARTTPRWTRRCGARSSPRTTSTPSF